MKKFATAVAVTMIGASLAFAAPQHEQHEQHEGGKAWGGPGRGQMMTFTERFGTELSLTAEQKTKIDALQKETREANKAFFDEQRKTMQEMFAARDANDTAKLDTLKPVVDAQRAKMKTIREAEDAKIAKLLTADQNTKWQQLKAEAAARRQNRQ
jgi:Spy/CpxP family protein refolding chaperone